MSDGLREELQEIRGIGDAKADQIMSVVDEYTSDSGFEGVCRDALELLEDGHASHAESYLRGELEGD